MPAAPRVASATVRSGLLEEAKQLRLGATTRIVRAHLGSSPRAANCALRGHAAIAVGTTMIRRAGRRGRGDVMWQRPAANQPAAEPHAWPIDDVLALENLPAEEEEMALAVRLHALRVNEAPRMRPLPPSQGLMMLELKLHEMGLSREMMEGHCAPEQLDFLRSFVGRTYGQSACHMASGIRMCQIGFNAGHSATALLEAAPTGSVLLSLDLGNHEYTRPLEKEVVSRVAEQRGSTHILLVGDSAEMLPRFKDIAFDLVFIDGNHAYEAVWLDLWNSIQLASHETVLLVDHIFTDMLEGVGPTRAWLEAVRRGDVEQRGWHSCCGRHGIAIGAVAGKRP